MGWGPLFLPNVLRLKGWATLSGRLLFCAPYSFEAQLRLLDLDLKPERAFIKTVRHPTLPRIEESGKRLPLTTPF